MASGADDGLVAQALAGERDLDVDYLWSLSDDALPALADALPTVAPDDRAAIVDRICFVRVAGGARFPGSIGPDVVHRDPVGSLEPGAGAPGGPDVATGLGANRAATRAAEVRSEVCPG